MSQTLDISNYELCEIKKSEFEVWKVFTKDKDSIPLKSIFSSSFNIQ